jgi:hypothetical protein
LAGFCTVGISWAGIVGEGQGKNKVRNLDFDRRSTGTAKAIIQSAAVLSKRARDDDGTEFLRGGSS